MKKLIILFSSALMLGLFTANVSADPENDRKQVIKYFKNKFKGVEVSDYKNGVYSIDQASRKQWEAMEEFPPYEPFVDMGKAAWEKPFKNGKTYASCFPGKKLADIRPSYPHWDKAKSKVVTLERALQDCALANGSKLKWKKGKIAYISAYLAYEARGKKVNVVIPNDPKAKEAYEKGKQFYYAKRGQLNFSCADCHIYNSGMRARAELLSPALGHTTHFPVFRTKWSRNPKGDGFGTLHRRFGGCNKNIRSKPFKAQGKEYSNLEYFLAYMSNGLEINGPGARK